MKCIIVYNYAKIIEEDPMKPSYYQSQHQHITKKGGADI